MASHAFLHTITSDVFMAAVTRSPSFHIVSVACDLFIVILLFDLSLVTGRFTVILLFHFRVIMLKLSVWLGVSTSLLCSIFFLGFRYSFDVVLGLFETYVKYVTHKQGANEYSCVTSHAFLHTITSHDFMAGVRRGSSFRIFSVACDF